MLAEDMKQESIAADLIKANLVKSLMGQLKILLERDLQDLNRKEKILKSKVSYKKMTKYANRTGARMIPFSAKLTKEQMKELGKQCKKNYIAFAAMKNKTVNTDGSYNYSIIIFEKDAAMFRDIQEKMLKEKMDIDKQEETGNGDPSAVNEQTGEDNKKEKKEEKKEENALEENKNSGRQDPMPMRQWEKAVEKRKEASVVNEGMEQVREHIHAAKNKARGI